MMGDEGRGGSEPCAPQRHTHAADADVGPRCACWWSGLYANCHHPAICYTLCASTTTTTAPQHQLYPASPRTLCLMIGTQLPQQSTRNKVPKSQQLTVVLPQRLDVDAASLVKHTRQLLRAAADNICGSGRGLGRGIRNGPAWRQALLLLLLVGPADPAAADCSTCCMLAADQQACMTVESSLGQRLSQHWQQAAQSSAGVREGATAAAENIGNAVCAPGWAIPAPATRLAHAMCLGKALWSNAWHHAAETALFARLEKEILGWRRMACLRARNGSRLIRDTAERIILRAARRTWSSERASHDDLSSLSPPGCLCGLRTASSVWVWCWNVCEVLGRANLLFYAQRHTSGQKYMSEFGRCIGTMIGQGSIVS